MRVVSISNWPLLIDSSSNLFVCELASPRNIGIRGIVLINLLLSSLIVSMSFLKDIFFFFSIFTSSAVLFLVTTSFNLIDSTSSDDSPTGTLKGSAGRKSVIGLNLSAIIQYSY